MIVRCPYCNAVLRLPEKRKTDKVKCPKCKKTMSLKKQNDGTAVDSQTIVAGRKRGISRTIPEGLSVELEILEGEKTGKAFSVKKTNVVVGRSDGDIRIDDHNVSKKHMAVEIWSSDSIYLRDLASTNGTYLNGARIFSSKLKNGDIIKIGGTKLRVRIKAGN
ncbi:MAG TPA: FHA domain-containing protein [bacterium]